MPGRRLGPYEILAPLGRGGMGEVFQARDSRLDRIVAVKRIRVDRRDRPTRRARFRREARALARLNHPAIIQLFDLLQEDDEDWLVTEFVDGSTLRERLESGPLSSEEVLDLGRQLAAGLAAAHASGVAHRDLKAENVLLTARGEIKIVDFGLAKDLAPDQAPKDLTGEGCVGTLPSMSPEQVRGEEIDSRTDLFSLGVLLYECLCGISPFAGPSPPQTLQRILQERPAPVREVEPGVPESLSHLIDHLLEKDPALRPQSAREVELAIGQMACSPPRPTDDRSTLVSAPPARPRSGEGRRAKLHPNRPWVVLAAAAAAVLVLAATWPSPLGFVLALSGWLGPAEHPPLPEDPSVVVLPFTNLSADPQHDILCDTLAEDLTSDLSSSAQLFVVSRMSALTYAGQSVRIERIGRELGVRYVVEGSVRSTPAGVRVNARLTDAATGFQLWSQRYEHSPEELFALQSSLSEALFGALKVGIGEAELRRIRHRPTADLTAYQAYQRGLFLMHENTRASNLEARRLFERAVDLDPGFADALALQAATHGLEYLLRWTLDPAALERSARIAQRALALDERTVDAHVSLAANHIARNEPQQAIAHVARALELDPNHHGAHTLNGAALALSGRRLEGLRAMNRALRLNPRAPSISWSAFATLQYSLGRRSQAVAVWERVRAANPDLLHPRVWLLLAHADSDPAQRAATLVEEIRSINPQLDAQQAAEHFGLVGGSEARAVADRRDKLRRLGLP